jgi:hypothetical protein
VCFKIFPARLLGIRLEARNCISEPGRQEASGIFDSENLKTPHYVKCPRHEKFIKKTVQNMVKYVKLRERSQTNGKTDTGLKALCDQKDGETASKTIMISEDGGGDSFGIGRHFYARYWQSPVDFSLTRNEPKEKLKKQ